MISVAKNSLTVRTFNSKIDSLLLWNCKVHQDKNLVMEISSS